MTQPENKKTLKTLQEEITEELIEQIPQMMDFDKASGSRYVHPDKAREIFLDSLTTLTTAIIEQVVDTIEAGKQELPKTKCLNVENHLFGS